MTWPSGKAKRRRRRHRTTCFAYHSKICVVCGEPNMVTVHHRNENKDDNRPQNLIPMCPTHHWYVHHPKLHKKVTPIIDRYMELWTERFIGPLAKSGKATDS